MEKITMRKIKEVINLRFKQKHSYKNIALSLNIGETTAREYIARTIKAGITDVDNLNDEEIEKLLYPSKEKNDEPASLPDFSSIHKDLTKKGVTLALLWKEYMDDYPNRYSYSRFCNLYKEWSSCLDVWMHQNHKAGESIFVDYSGVTIPIFDLASK